MENRNNESRLIGFFTVGPNREVVGDLSLADENSSLHLWDHSPFLIDLSSETAITGTLDDRRKVSLIRCILTGRSLPHSPDGASEHYNIFPHYVVVGNRHFSEQGGDISSISFVLGDATILFYDDEAYGSVSDQRLFLEQLVNTEKPGRNIDIGEFHTVSYYTGKQEIFSAETVIGQISARHTPTFSLGDSPGVSVRKEVSVTIEFDDKVSIIEACSRMARAVHFFALMVGRAQNIVRISVDSGTAQAPQTADVYISMSPKYQRSEENFWRHRFDVLIVPVQNPDKFASVMAAWLKRDIKWRSARSRLFQGWGEQDYSPDRIIKAANVFDLLPGEEFPSNENLPVDFRYAVKEAQKMFNPLPSSIERDSVLSALGRVGKWPLKRKIHHRAQILIDRIGERIPEICWVTDKAVNHRNHYVHGTSLAMTEEQASTLLDFLTDTLEFVFFASDLIDMGWDIVSWMQRPRSPGGHPFFSYLVSYRHNLDNLRSIC